MKRLIMFVLCFQVITLVSAQDNLEGKWELTTFHYIERAYPPVISEYEITQIFQFTNDGIFKLL